MAWAAVNPAPPPVPIRVPERDRRPGVFYAVSDDGIELPVIDVTHPSFAIDDSAAVLEQAWADERKRQEGWTRQPTWRRRLMLWLARRNSILLQSLWQAEGTFLTAMATYRMKLGPANQGAAYTKRLDTRIAAGASILDVRLRLQRVAHLLAEALMAVLRTRPSAPVHFVDIAGGPAIDAINALILIRRHAPGLLLCRPIRLHVLDAHREAPDFGARALAALQSDGGPLRGLDCTFEYRRYDWNDPAILRELLAGFEPDAVAAASSEGGLFQYGSDEAIVGNLAVLHQHTRPEFTVTGTLSPATPENLHARRMIRVAIRHLDATAFGALAQRAGWRLDRVLESPRTQTVRLVKA